MTPLRDLQPVKDPFGGSPKTPPGGFRVPIYQDPPTPLPVTISNGNGNGSVWKVVACSAITALMGMTVAYFTALRGQGVSQTDVLIAVATARKDMQEYTDKNSPYAKDKELLSKDNSNQDRAIGQLAGKQEQILEQLKSLQEKNIEYNSSFTDINGKLKFLGDTLEGIRKDKR